jgi:hypothetical protein
MRKSDWILSFVFVVALGVIGCEKQESAPSTPATPATPSTPAAPAPSAAADSAPAAVPAAPTTPDATPAAAAAAANESATAATQAVAGNAAVGAAETQKLIDQAMAYIKDNKLDLAEKAVTQLEGMKASLSPEMAKQVDNARSLLDTAKKAGAVKLPALPGASQ